MIRAFRKSLIAPLVCFTCCLNGEPAQAYGLDQDFNFSPSCAEYNLYRNAPLIAFQSGQRKWYDTENISENCDWEFSGDRVFLYALQVIEGRKVPEAIADPSNDRIIYSFGLLVAADYYEGGSKAAFNLDKSRELHFQASLRGNTIALNEFLDLSIRKERIFDAEKAGPAIDAVVDFGPLSCFGLYHAFTRVFHAPDSNVSDAQALAKLKRTMARKLKWNCPDVIDFYRQAYKDGPTPSLVFLMERE